MCQGPSLVLETLHLWERSRHHPKGRLGLDLAWSADFPAASVLGPQDRARMLGTAELAFEGLGSMLRMPFSFHGRDEEAENQDTEQAGEN